MRKIAASVTLAVGLAASGSQAAADARTGAKVLFGPNTGELGEAAQVEVFEGVAGNITLAPDGKSFVDVACEQPVRVEVSFPDLNSDKTPDVLLALGNTCMGHAGASVALFIRDESAHDRLVLFAQGISADPQPEKSQGFPDLPVGGPGFCQPIWRWNGKAYAYYPGKPEQPGARDEAR